MKRYKLMNNEKDDFDKIFKTHTAFENMRINRKIPYDQKVFKDRYDKWWVKVLSRIGLKNKNIADYTYFPSSGEIVLKNKKNV